jgi:tetratricopeptide (TPR) repeat protein
MMWFAVPLLVLGLSAAGSEPVAKDSDVLRGVVLAESGDYDGAIGVLEGVVVAAPEKRRDSKDLAVAYAYLGVARVGKGQDDKARELFATALGIDKGLLLSSPKVPPHARALFEAVRKQPPAKAEVEQGHGSRAPLILLGLAAAGGGAYAIAHRSTTDSGPTPTKTDTFTGVLDAKQASSSVTLGPARAGPWVATLSYEDPIAALQLAVFTTSSSLVANATQNTPTSLVANWNGAEGTSYRIDWSLNAKNVKQAKYTLTVTHPSP